MTLYIEMFAKDAPTQSKQAPIGQIALAGQTTQTDAGQDSDSDRTPSEDEEDNVEAQHKTLQAVMERLKMQLEVQQLPAQDKGKRKADEVDSLDLEVLAMDVMIKANQNGMTLENEVQIQVDTIQARKKSRGDQ